jgi:trehalose-phosphatase
MPVVIVSGRDQADVRNLVGIPEIVYAGSHGLEIQGPDLCLELPEGVDALEDLDKAAEKLDELLQTIPGARLERKRFALVVHYSDQDGGSVGRVESAVRLVQARFPRLQKTGGKEVFELLPDIDWDKGRVVSWLLSELGLDNSDVLPIYIGDDVTDEGAFRALRVSGLGILVADRPQPSAATYRVSDTDQVTALLRYIVETEKEAS